MSRPVVFVHTDNAQLLPALVAIHALRTRGGANGSFDVRLLRMEGSRLDARSDGRPYRYGRGERIWDHTRAWSFHYLRRRPPELLGYRGRALVIDPDVFAVRSIRPLLERDMEGKAIHCRYAAKGYAGDGKPVYSSGVLLLDCGKLENWRFDAELDELFAGKRDYLYTMQMLEDDPSTIGELGAAWNSFDELNHETGLLHLTRLSTQPWLTGLEISNDRYDPTAPVPVTRWWHKALGIEPKRRHRPHPDPVQERFFFELLTECLDGGLLPEAYIRHAMHTGRLRRDATKVLARCGYRRGRARGAALLHDFGIEEEVAPR